MPLLPSDEFLLSLLQEFSCLFRILSQCLSCRSQTHLLFLAFEEGNAKLFLKENPDVAGKIEIAIRQNAGLIAEKILAGEDGDSDAAEG